MKKIVHNLVTLLMEKKLTLAIAESMTCGLASHQLNIVKGTSEVFMGGIVCYNEKVKQDLLHVKPELIEKFTAESQEVTDQLAGNLKQIMAADIYAAITGLATSDGSETREKPVGTVFFTVIFEDEITTLKKKFKGTPLQIKKKACEELYKLIIRTVKKHF